MCGGTVVRPSALLRHSRAWWRTSATKLSRKGVLTGPLKRGSHHGAEHDHRTLEAPLQRARQIGTSGAPHLPGGLGHSEPAG